MNGSDMLIADREFLSLTIRLKKCLVIVVHLLVEFVNELIRGTESC